MFLLWLRQLPCFGDLTPASVPLPVEGRSSPTHTPDFPPSSFILLSFVWFYIFFSTYQILLSTLSWYSACTSLSEGVFLMYPWREMYSMSTYFSAIFFSPKEPLDESERGEWKSWLKAQHSENEDHGIWPHHFMQIDGETMESDRLYFLGLQNHCRWWLQPWN